MSRLRKFVFLSSRKGVFDELFSAQCADLRELCTDVRLTIRPDYAGHCGRQTQYSLEPSFSQPQTATFPFWERQSNNFSSLRSLGLSKYSCLQDQAAFSQLSASLCAFRSLPRALAHILGLYGSFHHQRIMIPCLSYRFYSA